MNCSSSFLVSLRDAEFKGLRIKAANNHHKKPEGKDSVGRKLFPIINLLLSSTFSSIPLALGYRKEEGSLDICHNYMSSVI